MITVRGAYRILRAAYTRFDKHDGIAMAGYIAFSSLLAIFPFLIFSAALVGLLVGPEQNEEAVNALFRVAPEHIAQTLEPVLHEVLVDRGQGVLTLSILVTIFLASNAIDAFRVAFDRAYDVTKSRGFLLRRLISLAFVFIGASVAVIMAVSIIFTPLMFQLAERWLDMALPASMGVLIFILGVSVFVLFLIALHRVLPSRAMSGRRIWPGVMVSLILWLLGAVAFSIYLSLVPTYAVTYGTLTGVMILAMFFYLTGVAIIFGAEVNAVLKLTNATDKPT
ncbi:MAG: YihY/virulence factor BrkB family protein [Rhodobacteraceae bacterium]|nr:YihY/virulence factor BrkB family protein [Paracoccaceae bacterium]